MATNHSFGEPDGTTTPEESDRQYRAMLAAFQNLPGEWLCSETAFALAAAVLSDELPEGDAALHRKIGVPVEGVAMDAPYQARHWVRLWRFRAALLYGNLCAGVPKNSTTLRGRHNGAAVAIEVAGMYEDEDAMNALLPVLSDAARQAYEALQAHVQKPPHELHEETMLLYASPSQEAAAEPYCSPTLRNAIACLVSGGDISETDALLFLNTQAKEIQQRLRSRVEIREMVEAGKKQGVAFAHDLPDGGPFIAPKRAPDGAEPITCPACYLHWYARRSLAMNCGANFGGAFCPACGSRFEIRVWNDALQVPDIRNGSRLKAFREGLAPEEMRRPDESPYVAFFDMEKDMKESVRRVESALAAQGVHVEPAKPEIVPGMFDDGPKREE